MTDLKIPIEKIRQFLEEQLGVHYSSNHYIYSQLKSFEHDAGIRLFRKITLPDIDSEFCLTIHDKIDTFEQKKHLYVSQRIKVANGVFDHIKEHALQVPTQQPLRILLGAGVVPYHLAKLLGEAAKTSERPIHIYSHNMGILSLLAEEAVTTPGLSLFTRTGPVDPANFIILDQFQDLYKETVFDFIIQGTSVLHDGNLYVSNSEEWKLKKSILQASRGEKILVLTLKEFQNEAPEGITPYGRLEDYDFIVVPHRRNKDYVKKSYDYLFERYHRQLSLEIQNYNFKIYRVKN